jgi:anti-anti-sigma factor
MPLLRVDAGLNRVFLVSGELDLSAADFERAVESCIDGRGVVVLDLADVMFVDSTGLRSILRLASASLRASSCCAIRVGWFDACSRPWA